VEIARRANYDRDNGVPDPLDANNLVQAIELRQMHDQELSGWKGNLRPLLTRDPAVCKKRQSLTMCQRALRLATSTNVDKDCTHPSQLHVFIAPARLCVLVHLLWLCM
jgi:hypothetical protein